jgi:predicted dehydrogenase
LVILRFENGALGLVEATTNVYPRNLEHTVAIFGESGTIVQGGTRVDELKVWRVVETSERQLPSHYGEQESAKYNGYWGHMMVLVSFLRDIEAARLIGVEVDCALQAIGTIEAVSR